MSVKEHNITHNAGFNVDFTEVTYSLLKNTGNYENERIELTAKVHKGQCPDAIALALKERATDILSVLSRFKKKNQNDSHRQIIPVTLPKKKK